MYSNDNKKWHPTISTLSCVSDKEITALEHNMTINDKRNLRARKLKSRVT